MYRNYYILKNATDNKVITVGTFKECYKQLYSVARKHTENTTEYAIVDMYDVIYITARTYSAVSTIRKGRNGKSTFLHFKRSIEKSNVMPVAE